MADNSLFSTNGKIGVNRASENDIKAKANAYSLVPPTMIDLLVKVGMTTNSLEWTEEEKAKALKLLGVILSEFGTPIADRVVITGAGGQVTVGEPTMYNSATTKKYVDDLVGDIETALDSIITIQETLIGGDA